MASKSNNLIPLLREQPPISSEAVGTAPDWELNKGINLLV
jgi:hypothetical protein